MKEFVTFVVLPITAFPAQLIISVANALIHSSSTKLLEYVAVLIKPMKLSMDLSVNVRPKLTYLIILASVVIFRIAHSASKMGCVSNATLDLF